MNTVEFPGLGGLKFTIDPIALSFGSISIYWYGIIIAAAFMTAVLLALKHSEKFGIKQDDLIDLVLFAAPAGIIGARLYYVIFSWDSYKDDLSEIYKIWHGGLAIYGGIIVGILTAILFARYRKIKPLHLLDFAVPYIPLAQAIGRWGNFINQEAFGSNTNMPWGMTSNIIKNTLYVLQMEGKNVNPDIPVHPTFLYESLLDALIFTILIRQRKVKKADGEIVYLYMALYGLGRFLIEGLRTDSLMLGNLRISQVLSAVFAIVFSVLFIRARKKADINTDEAVAGTSEYGNVLADIKETERLQEMGEASDESQDEDKEAVTISDDGASTDTDTEEDADNVQEEEFDDSSDSSNDKE